MADLSDIINTLIAEANGEGPEGMRRVGETILNRAAIRGLSPEQVVRQPHQYTGYSAPGPAAIAAQHDPRSVSAAEAAWALARQPGDPTNGADHYKANYVNPDWASQMPSTGSYGAHDFYRSRDVPQDALSRLLAPSAPTPASMPASVQGQRARSDALNSLRTAQMAPSDADVYAGIFAQPDLTQPGAVQQSVAETRQDPALARALASLVTRSEAPRAVPAMPMGGSQSYAGQEAARRASQSLFGEDPGTPAQGRVVGTVSTGQSPSTRTVQSVPARPSSSAGASVQTARSEQSAARGAGTPQRPAAPETAVAAIASMFGSPAAQPRGTTSNGKAQDRLFASPDMNGFAPGPAQFGGLDPALVRAPATPAIRGAPVKPAATTQIVRQQVINPAWTAAQQAPKIDPVGAMPSWGDFASTFAPKKAAPLPAKYITVKKTVPVAAPKVRPPAAVPQPAARAPLEITVQGSNTVQPQQPKSAVQKLRDQGLSASQAYDQANAQARERARAGATSASHVSSNDYFNRVTSGKSGSSSWGDTAY